MIDGTVIVYWSANDFVKKGNTKGGNRKVVQSIDVNHSDPKKYPQYSGDAIIEGVVRMSREMARYSRAVLVGPGTAEFWKAGEKFDDHWARCKDFFIERGIMIMELEVVHRPLMKRDAWHLTDCEMNKMEMAKHAIRIKQLTDFVHFIRRFRKKNQAMHVMTHGLETAWTKTATKSPGHTAWDENTIAQPNRWSSITPIGQA